MAVAIALPALGSAHQLATLDGGRLTITGDQQGKLNDLITIKYDSSASELVIGNDVFGPHPAPCRPDSVNPERVIHCPASLISEIFIDSGTGNDNMTAALPATPIQAVMGAGNDSFLGGSEVDVVNLGSGSDKADGGPGNDRLRGGPGSDKLRGGPGADSLFGGASPDKLFGGPGNDQCSPGSGRGKQLSC
jgi:Ca2+-binding RTX toxin-like protein